MIDSMAARVQSHVPSVTKQAHSISAVGMVPICTDLYRFQTWWSDQLGYSHNDAFAKLYA